MSVTSIEGRARRPGYAAYAAAKAGVHQLHEDRRPGAGPLRDPGERPGPGHHLDRGLAAIAPDPGGMQERFGHTVPMGRAGHVDEMAGAAIFLARDLSCYVTGQTIHVDGGTHAASGWYHHPETRRVRPRAPSNSGERFRSPLPFRRRPARRGRDMPPSTGIICPVM